MNQFMVKPPIYFGAQAADVRFNDVGLGVEMKLPHHFEKHGPGYDLPGVPHQTL